MEAIIASIITGFIAAVSSICAAKSANDRLTAVLEERIGALSKQVEKHNSVIERTYKLEARVDIMEGMLNAKNHD